MHEIEFFIALLLAVALLARVAHHLRVPFPILLVLGGLGIALVPGVPEIELAPEVVFLVFLPPLLYAAAFFSSPRELRGSARQIGLLSIGLVTVSIFAVALVAHTVVGELSWAAAFVLGAILAPTDPVAATSVFRRLGAPQRVTTIVEGESLVNDGTGLVAYRLAVGAVLSGTFSLGDAALEVVKVGAGGIAIGLALGWIVVRLRRRLDDPPVEITISLFTGYAAYIPAEELGVSGVLATVTAGLYIGWQSPGLFLPGTRLQAYSFWEILTFLLDSVLFILVGTQLARVLDDVAASPGTLLGYAGAVAGAVIGARFLFLFTVPYVVRGVNPRIRRRGDRVMPVRERVLLGWSGMRGAISVAAALALPIELPGGVPFAERDLILFLTFTTVFVTLVVQGLTLPALVRALGLRDPDAGSAAEARARLRAAHAALARIEQLASQRDLSEDAVERVRAAYERRAAHVASRVDGDGDGHHAAEDYVRLRREALAAERRTMIGLRDQGEIGAEVMRRIERDLDLEEERLEG